MGSTHTECEWDDAIRRAKWVLEARRKAIDSFVKLCIDANTLLRRYDAGDRSDELYKELYSV